MAGMGAHNSITDVPGLIAGHATDRERLTGCTVVLFDHDAIAGAFLAGAATSTRQIDSLSPHHFVEGINAIFLTGGSAFGLDAAAGVMRFLEEKGKGLQVRYAKVPIVPTAAIFDLALGDHLARPSPEMAYEACEAASSEPLAEGSIGAGVGASVGKLFGIEHACKGGVGSCSRVFPDGLTIAALTVVNAFGDIVDPRTGQVIAGVRDPSDPKRFCNAAATLSGGGVQPPGFSNTVLSVVATNACLTKPQATHLARMAAAGIARAVNPAHTNFDGDLVFAVSTGNMASNLNALGAAAAELVSESILRAIKAADGFGLIPAWKDLQKDEG